MNRGNWKWFRLETILNNIDMKKPPWFNHILSINREYKPRNYFKNVSFTLLIMNRGNWMCFRLETILNNIDMKKPSWFNNILSINREYKPRNYLKNVSFTLLIMNRRNWKCFRLETILKIVSFTLLNMNRGKLENTSLETILKMFHLPYLSWTDVTECASG